ncbi:MAG TPA: hypothetical protein VNO81_07600, partial [Candidatus Nitrosotenuis sp.]|nr:hypothetical protein [Candidatus Nitrosotenuis sp.]
GESRPLELALDNRGDGPVRVRVALAAVGPSTDEIYAGHLAAWRLVDLQQRGQSYIVQVPPGRELVLDRRLLKAGQTVSGMGWLEVLEGGPVQLVVRALETDGRTSQRELPAPDTGGALGTGEGLFEPYRQEDYFHQAGSAYTFIPLGGEPYGRDPQTGEINPGNFGLVYRLRIRIDNPAGETRLAWLDFVPRAGPARAILFLDGRLVETPMQEYAASLRLATWTLEPGQSVETSVETFPQAGSNYPAFLVVGSGRP